MNKVWRNLWAGCIKDVSGGSSTVDNVNKETQNVAQEVSFVNLTSEDDEEVSASHIEEL